MRNEKQNAETAAPVPADMNAEMAVIGAMMLGGIESVTTARETLTENDFYRDSNRLIFAAMVRLADAQTAVDPVTVKHELTRADELEKAGGLVYLLQTGDIEFLTVNLADYAPIVKEQSIRRGVMQAAQAIYTNARDEMEPIDDVLSKAAKTLETCAQNAIGSGARIWSAQPQLISDFWDDLDDLRSRGGGLAGYSTGLEQVDSITDGLVDGDLVIIAARPAMGKTGLLTTIGSSVAKTGLNVAFFSCEMRKKIIQQRLFASEASVDLRRIRRGKLFDDEYARIVDAQERLYHMPFFIDDTSAPSVSVLENRARQIKKEQGGLDLILVDYIQRLEGPPGSRSNGGNRTEEVTKTVRLLKTMAANLECPVIALSQLSRRVEQREDKRPMLSDLYESGGIEAEADLVGFLYRPSYYAGKTEEEAEEESAPDYLEESEFIVEKSRNGRTGIVKIGFAPRYVRFQDLPTEGKF